MQANDDVPQRDVSHRFLVLRFFPRPEVFGVIPPRKLSRLTEQ